MKTRFLKLIGLCCLAILLVGCSSDNLAKPAKLVSFKSTIKTDEQWSHHTRAGRADPTYLTLQMGYDANNVYVVGPYGVIYAFNQQSGDKVWDRNLKTHISGGVSVGNNLAIVTSSTGVVYALNTSNGQVQWQQTINQQVLGVAAIANNIVVVKSVTDNVFALSADNGAVLWTYSASAPGLTLRGGSAPAIAGQQVILGFANGKMANVTLTNGNLNWQQVIADPQGIFPVQRMVDIVATPFIRSGVVYVATYQGNLAALELATGEVIWNHQLSTYTGLALSDSALYVTDANSTILSFAPDSGNVIWKQEVLANRMITAPALMGNYLVVGDAEGYVHWFDQQTGNYAARDNFSDEPIRATPLVINDMVYILDTRGYIAAYKIRPRN